ncbi:hypothetical protein [Lacticaseibacillus chiayiensis]|uniref:hypothetical protein n=1 Tax=Lacticaseibacillus chiayiensis TaxID=2100821 RepID=UPI001EDCB84F|nr:hypothetical protein [Lacticaseibacillus chiayiensis]
MYRELQEGHYYEAHVKDYTRFVDIKETPKRGRQVIPKEDAIQQAKATMGLLGAPNQ